jgi:hypothetical protein
MNFRNIATGIHRHPVMVQSGETATNPWRWSRSTPTNPRKDNRQASGHFHFTIKRSEWEKGNEQGFLFHKTPERICRCGLGFACKALGVADEQLDHVRQVDALVAHHVIEPHALGPLRFLIDLKSSSLIGTASNGQKETQESAHETVDAIRIMAINDRQIGKDYLDEYDRYLFDIPVIRSETHREKLLKMEFAKHDIDIVFVD